MPTLLRIIFLFSAIFLSTSLSAKECKINIGFSDGARNSKIVDYEDFTIKKGATKNRKVKHMRKAWNAGDFDIKVYYWDGSLTLEIPPKKIIKDFVILKGDRSSVVSGNVTKVKCLRTVQGSRSGAAKRCKLKALFASGPINPWHDPSLNESYDPIVGTTESSSNVRKQHLRKITNYGLFDAKIEVKGLGTPALWKKLNVGDSVIGQYDLQAVSCIDSRSQPLSFLDKIKEDVDNGVKSGHIIGQDIVDKLGIIFDSNARLRSAPSSCLLNGRDNYENRYMGQSSLGSQNKFKNLKLNSEFSLINNYLFMQAAGKTYFDQIRYKHREAQTETEFMCGAQELYNHWGFKKVQFINTPLSGNAIVGSNDKAIVISIRGTQTPWKYGNSYSAVDDIKGILDIGVSAAKLLVPAAEFGLPSKGNVHIGYAVNAALLADSVEKALDNIQNVNNKKIYVTGHSLGAATASILTYFIQVKSKYNVTATYLYASPEVGDERLTRDLYKVAPYYFTNNYRDPIPSIGRKPFEHPGQVFDLSSALYASREIVYFKENHDYILFPDKSPSLDRKRKISRIQGSPQPVGLFRRNNASTTKFLISPEWHFHNGNFYIAHTYSALIQSNFSKKSGTGIQPEFSKTELCITNDKRVADLKVVGWDGVTAYKLLKNDKQSYPFIQCQ